MTWWEANTSQKQGRGDMIPSYHSSFSMFRSVWVQFYSPTWSLTPTFDLLSVHRSQKNDQAHRHKQVNLERTEKC